jgi:DnaJ domain
VDPFAVLGVQPGASREEVQAAYRRAAKRWHPDRDGSPAAARRMAEVNAAWDLLRDGTTAPPDGRSQTARRPAWPRAGAWLAPALRKALGPELLSALEPGEDVAFAVPTATWASPQALLAVTDRRLLWLLDDAVSHRIRSLRFADVASADQRARGRLRRQAVLRIVTREGRRLEFAELRPATATEIVRRVREGSVAPRRPAAAG